MRLSRRRWRVLRGDGLPDASGVRATGLVRFADRMACRGSVAAGRVLMELPGVRGGPMLQYSISIEQTRLLSRSLLCARTRASASLRSAAALLISALYRPTPQDSLGADDFSSPDCASLRRVF